MQQEANLKDYKPGNILLIHLDFAKKKSRFIKNKERLTNLVNLFLIIL
jgi:hypothetical protein